MTERAAVTSDGSRIAVEGAKLSLQVMTAQVHRVTYDLSVHPLGSLAVEYLLEMAGDWASGTLANHANRLQVLLRDYLEPGQDLSPVTLRAFAKWLQEVSGEAGARRYTPLVAAQTARAALRLYRYGAMRGHAGWSSRNLDLMVEMLRREFRGAGREHYLRSAQRAISEQEYQQLLRAAGMEMQECVTILRRRAAWRARPHPAVPTRAPAGRPGTGRAATARRLRKLLRWAVENRIPCDLDQFAKLAGVHRSTLACRYPQVARRVRAWCYLSGERSLASICRHARLPDPYCVFALLVGLRNGVRAEEWNLMQIGDVDGTYLTLRSDDHLDIGAGQDVQLERATIEAYQVLLDWTEDLRERAPHHLKGALQLAEDPAHGVHRVTTAILATTRLRNFYRKYFSGSESGAGERVLSAEGSPDKPFSSSFLKFRNAAIRNFLNHEENPALVQAFARHRSFSTTAQSYSQTHAADFTRRVAGGLAARARMYEISLKSQVYEHLTPELRAIDAGGGATPYGFCGDSPRAYAEAALPAAGCALARDCLECPHLFLHVEKRSFLEADAVQLLDQAARLEAEGMVRDAENVRGAAALRLAHINRIDQLTSGRRAA